MKATVVQFETQGPPDVMRHVEVEIPDPSPGQVMIEQTVLGLKTSLTFTSGAASIP